MPNQVFGWPEDCDMDDCEPADRWRCDYCGAFLKQKPDRHDQWERKEKCSGEINPHDPFDGECNERTWPHEPHEYIADCGSAAVFVCSKCTKETRIV